jgi:hypothetical protein
VFLKITQTSLYLAISLSSLAAFAASPTRMVIKSAPQTVAVGSCSSAVTVEARDRNSAAANVPTNTKIFFTGSASSLRFFKDSSCLTSASTVLMAAGTSSVPFYFKGTTVGTPKIIVATYDYIDGSQIETIASSTTPTTPPPTTTTLRPPTTTTLPPTTTTTLPTTTTTMPPTTTTTTLPVSTGGIRGRAVPAPIYGVTLDDIANVSGIVASLKAVAHMPTARVVFDAGNAASYYKSAITQMRGSSYVMGELLDSTDMAVTSVAAYQKRTQDYVAGLGNLVDIWEIGNEINGNWLGSNTTLTGDKVRAAFDVVHGANGATALTFFWEGNPGDANNCVDGPGFDMFGWISNFLKNPANERVRVGLDYVFISWYPQQCNNIKPNWTDIYNKLAVIFPNAKVGFGEIGTANPQGGSTYEVNLINEFYPMASKTSLPQSYVGGYFWWYFYEEMIPTTKTPLMNVLNQAILAGPQP